MQKVIFLYGLVCNLLLLGTIYSLADTTDYLDPDEDWAYGCSSNSQQIYRLGQTPHSSKEIPFDVSKKDWRNIFVILRDNALFKKFSCNNYIDRYNLETKYPASLAVAFYKFQNGDTTQLKVLLKSFDKLDKGSESLEIELFGYMNEWDKTISRMARQYYYADGASAEELDSAIQWRRFLYGKQFDVYWTKALKEEYVPQAEVQKYKKQQVRSSAS